MLFKRALNHKFYFFQVPAVKEIKPSEQETSHCDISTYQPGVITKAGSQRER